MERISDTDVATPLSAIAQRFVLHWGEMSSRWGVNRTVAQIHALLYLRGQPMHAEGIAETLGVARSNVSVSLRELENWGLVRVVHLLGDRRDHYETAPSCAAARHANSIRRSACFANASAILRSLRKARPCRRVYARRWR